MDSSQKEQVRRLWGKGAPRERRLQYATFPMSHPTLVAHSNLIASGNEAIDAYGHLREFLATNGHQLPLGRAASIGCGSGAVEIGMAKAGFFDHCTAFDIAEGALVEARDFAAREGVEEKVTFVCRDLDGDGLGMTDLDLVFAHQSVHHIENLERLFDNVKAAMRPGAILHLHEYVGPNRFQWTDRQVDEINAWLNSIPEIYLQTLEGQTRRVIERLSIEAMIEMDPSEAIRSADIEKVVADRFELLEKIELGGSLLMTALTGIAHNFDPDNAVDVHLLNSLIQRERLLIRHNILTSDFAVLTCRA